MLNTLGEHAGFADIKVHKHLARSYTRSFLFTSSLKQTKACFVVVFLYY